MGAPRLRLTSTHSLALFWLTVFAAHAAERHVSFARIRLPLDGQRVLALKHAFVGSPPRGVLWADTNFDGRFQFRERRFADQVQTAGMAVPYETFVVGPLPMTGPRSPLLGETCSLRLSLAGYYPQYRTPTTIQGSGEFRVGAAKEAQLARYRVMAWGVDALARAVSTGPRGPLRLLLQARYVQTQSCNVSLMACVGWPEANWRPPPTSPPIGLSVYDHGFDQTVIVLDLPRALPLSLVVTGASGEVAGESEPGELLDLLDGRAYPLSLPRGKYAATVVVDTGPVAGKLTASIPMDVRADPPPAVAKPPWPPPGAVGPVDGGAYKAREEQRQRLQWTLAVAGALCVVGAAVAFLLWDTLSRQRTPR